MVGLSVLDDKKNAGFNRKKFITNDGIRCVALCFAHDAGDSLQRDLCGGGIP